MFSQLNSNSAQSRTLRRAGPSSGAQVFRRKGLGFVRTFDVNLVKTSFLKNQSCTSVLNGQMLHLSQTPVLTSRPVVWKTAAEVLLQKQKARLK